MFRTEGRLTVVGKQLLKDTIEAIEKIDEIPRVYLVNNSWRMRSWNKKATAPKTEYRIKKAASILADTYEVSYVYYSPYSKNISYFGDDFLLRFYPQEAALVHCDISGMWKACSSETLSIVGKFDRFRPRYENPVYFSVGGRGRLQGCPTLIIPVSLGIVLQGYIADRFYVDRAVEEQTVDGFGEKYAESVCYPQSAEDISYYWHHVLCPTWGSEYDEVRMDFTEFIVDIPPSVFS